MLRLHGFMGAAATSRFVKIDFDLMPDFHHDPDTHAEAAVEMAMVRQ